MQGQSMPWGITRTEGAIHPTNHPGITLFKQAAFIGFFHPGGSQTGKNPEKFWKIPRWRKTFRKKAFFGLFQGLQIPPDRNFRSKRQD